MTYIMATTSLTAKCSAREVLQFMLLFLKIQVALIMSIWRVASSALRAANERRVAAVEGGDGQHAE